MKKGMFIVVAAILLIAGTAAACNNSSSDSGLKGRVDTLETKVNDLDTTTQNEAMVVAVQALGAAGLHAIDESANTDNEIVAGTAGPVGRAIQAVAAANWPSALQGQATDLQEKLQALADALATGDVNQVKAPATAAHEAQHEFEHAVTAVLNPAIGLPTEPPEEESGATGTPAAQATPAATAQ